MADERVPAFSAGARMHPVHPDDVRIAEGRDRASRGRRKVRGPALPSNPCEDSVCRQLIPNTLHDPLRCHQNFTMYVADCFVCPRASCHPDDCVMADAAQQEAACEKGCHGQRQGPTEKCSVFGHKDRCAQPCSLTPYWRHRLNKSAAVQASSCSSCLRRLLTGAHEAHTER